MAAPQAPMSKDSDFKEIKGRLVITAQCPNRTAAALPVNPYKWSVIVITPDQKRISFRYFDNGTIVHTETIKHLKKGAYQVFMSNDNLVTPAVWLSTETLGKFEVKYEAKKGKFYNVDRSSYGAGTRVILGTPIRKAIVVFEPLHRTLPVGP